jgi:hypothetical protein
MNTAIGLVGVVLAVATMAIGIKKVDRQQAK